MLISKRKLARVPFEAAEHVKFGPERIARRRPVDPKIALQQLYDLAAVMGPRLSAFLAAELRNAPSYGPICFSNIDDGFAWKPPFLFVVTTKGDFGRNHEGQSASFAALIGIADPSNHINTLSYLGRVLRLPLAEW